MRTIATLLCATALTVSALAANPAGAAVSPPQGTISCVITGSMTLTPPLTYTPSTKIIKVIGSATATSCNNSGVGGGKAPITGLKITTLGYLPPASSCSSFAAGPSFTKTKLVFKWRGVNAKGKTVTVATDTTTVMSAVFASIDPVTYVITSAPQTKSAFMGKTITMNLALDGEYTDLNTECGGTGIASLAFGTEYVPTVTVP